MPAASGDTSTILTVNVGSSSLKSLLVGADADERLDARVAATRLGAPDAGFRVTDARGTEVRHLDGVADHGAAFDALCEWLRATERADTVAAVGHRVVHGGRRYVEPTVVTDDVLDDLRSLIPLDPEHLPASLRAIECARAAFPEVPHVACFDTAFHRTMPPVARAVPLAAEHRGDEVERFGFHGLSYEYVVGALRAVDARAVDGRVVVAHLGSGSSMVALRDGASVDTTMGFTPAGGLMMSTRSGDLDPGIVLHLLSRGLDEAAVRRAVNDQAGLLGVSGRSGDMEQLLALEAHDPAAAAAVDLYCHVARKHLGALVAVLGGLDALVFTAGVGEHSPAVRARICMGIAHLGAAVDPDRNTAAAPVISTDDSTVVVRVVATDEDLVIARHARALIG